jgi:hypothetical protein
MYVKHSRRALVFAIIASAIAMLTIAYLQTAATDDPWTVLKWLAAVFVVLILIAALLDWVRMRPGRVTVHIGGADLDLTCLILSGCGLGYSLASVSSGGTGQSSVNGFYFALVSVFVLVLSGFASIQSRFPEPHFSMSFRMIAFVCESVIVGGLSAAITYYFVFPTLT